jgi:hypothetical protein
VIPTSEWKFFEGTEQRIRHLDGHVLENWEALWAGRPLPWDPEELARRRAAVLQEFDYPARVEAAFALDPSPDEARHLELHRRWALATLFETHPELVPLLADLHLRIAAFTPRVRGREATRADLGTILRESPDRELRETAWKATAPLAEAVRDDVLALVRGRELLAREIAGTGYPALAFHAQEHERGEATALLDACERFTRKAYQDLRKRIAGGLDDEDVAPWDLDFGAARLGELPAGSLPDPVGAARSQAEAWGFDRDRFPEVVAVPRLPVAAMSLPGDSGTGGRLLVAGAPGFEGLRGMFRGVGEALAAAHAGGRRYFLEREAPAMAGGAARLFEAALDDPDRLAAIAGAAPEAIRRHLESRRAARIIDLRRRAARVIFENLVYTQSALDPQRLHGDVMEQLLMEPPRPDPLWAADPFFVARPFANFAGIVGEMVAAQTWRQLGALFPDPASNLEAGAWLRERYLEPAARVPWEEKVAAATGSPLALTALAEELDVRYEQQSMSEETDDDEAVAEYFKDIDLTDLE